MFLKRLIFYLKIYTWKLLNNKHIFNYLNYKLLTKIKQNQWN